MHRQPLSVDCDDLPQALTEPGATFTTLRSADQLRGCCGTLEPARAVGQDVTETAFRAAFKDPRFEPVAENELDVISLDVSVLSPTEPISFADEADLLRQLRPGEDGLVIVAEGRRATLLPTVWKMLPEPRRFLVALKAKLGLAHDYWSERIEFMRYSTTSFTESNSD